MKLIKYLGALLITVVVLFLFVANFSSVSSHFKCVGEISSGENKELKTIFIVLEEYRWWVSLWSESDGNIKLEIPNKIVDYFSHVVEVGSQLQIYDPLNEMKWRFSTLSKTLALKVPFGFFDGKCEAIK